MSKITYYTPEQTAEHRAAVRNTNAVNFDTHPFMEIVETPSYRPNTKRRLFQVSRLHYYNHIMQFAFANEGTFGNAFTMFNQSDVPWLVDTFVAKPCDPHHAWQLFRSKPAVFCTRNAHCCGMSEIFGANECLSKGARDHKIPVGQFVACAATVTIRMYSHATWHTIVYANESDISASHPAQGIKNLFDKFSLGECVLLPMVTNGNTGNRLSVCLVRFTGDPPATTWEQVEQIHCDRSGRLL